MKVIGRYKTVYECDNSGKRKEGDGTSYPVAGDPSRRVKILDRAFCGKAKEQELNNAMAGIGEWYGPQLLDLTYSHGKFNGYVYAEECPAPPEPAEPETPYPPVPEDTQKHSGGRERTNGGIRLLYSMASILILGALTYFVFFDTYLNLVAGMGSPELANYCYTFNFSGITGIIGGVIAVVTAAAWLMESADGLYFTVIPMAYLGGMVLVFAAVALVIAALRFAYALFIALVPALLIIGAIIWLLRSVFSSGK